MMAFLSEFDWVTFLSSVGGAILLVIVAFKTPIGSWLGKGIQHQFDKKLVSFRADIDNKAKMSERRWQEYKSEKEIKFRLLQEIRANTFGDLMFALNTWFQDVRLIFSDKIDHAEQRKRITDTWESYVQFRDLYLHTTLSLPKDTARAIDQAMVSLVKVLTLANKGVNDQRDKQEEIFAEALDKLQKEVGPSIDKIEDQLRKMITPEVDN